MTPGELVEECGRAAAGLLGRLLGEGLVGAYLVGSGALGGVAPAIATSTWSPSAPPPCRGSWSGRWSPGSRSWP